jgi:hypothetical protein
MAINSQKLLPQAKLTSTKVNVEKKNVLLKKELINIRKTLISIDKLLLSNSLFQRKATELKRKDTERQRFKEKETRLERKKEKEITKDDKSSVPQLGIFDRINRFITFTFLGFLFNKFSKYLPQVLEFSKKIQPIAQFIESFIGNVFNGIVDFIDFGYDAHNKVSNFAKQIGGENFQKTFDDFSSNLTKFINLAIIAGMATMGGTDFGLGKKGGKPGLGSNSFQKSTAAEKVKNARIRNIQKKYGPGARKIYENALNNGKTPQQAEAAIKRGLKKGVSIRPGAESLAARTAKKGSIFSRGLGKASGRIATRVLGKAGKRLAGKVFGRIPIIGGLVDFLFALWSGEPIGRAAAKGVGATIGSALGTFIPIPFAGTILGGILGDIVGGALYDTIVGSRPDRQKVQGRSRGGPITRGRRKVRGVVKRTVRVTKSPPKVPPAKPGESIGGKKNLQKIFPEPVGQQKDKTVNPYGFLTDTANSLLGTDIAGALGAVFIKPFLGQLPTKEDYKNFGLAMNIWISNAMSKGLIGGNATGGFADGGIINNGMMGDISKWAEKSIEEMIKNKVTDAINNLKRNLGLEPTTRIGDPSAYGPGMRGGFSPTGIQKDIYEYLLSKGLDDNQALGIMANIHRESGFRLDAVGDSGSSFGLFQWHAGRRDRMIAAVSDWRTNWKGQIDYALSERGEPGPEYMRTSFGSPEDSANWWMRRWERPADYIQADKGPRVHREYLQSIPRSQGGRPSFPSGMQLGIEQGNLQSARELASSMGLTMTSGQRGPRFPGDESLHISGRAMDFSNVPSGTRGSAQMDKFAQEMVKKYGGSLKQLIYTPLGFGISNKKRVDLSHWGEATNNAHYDHVHVAFKDGGSVGFNKKSKNIGPLQNFPSYDQGSTFAIIPIETIRTVLIQSPSQNKISFTGGGGGVNSNDTNKSRMFVG